MFKSNDAHANNDVRQNNEASKLIPKRDKYLAQLPFINVKKPDNV